MDDMPTIPADLVARGWHWVPARSGGLGMLQGPRAQGQAVGISVSVVTYGPAGALDAAIFLDHADQQRAEGETWAPRPGCGCKVCTGEHAAKPVQPTKTRGSSSKRGKDMDATSFEGRARSGVQRLINQLQAEGQTDRSYLFQVIKGKCPDVPGSHADREKMRAAWVKACRELVFKNDPQAIAEAAQVEGWAEGKGLQPPQGKPIEELPLFALLSE